MTVLPALMTQTRERTEKIFSHYLRDQKSVAENLQAAMAYSVFNGGKRIRPLLVYAIGDVLATDLSASDIAASAIELIHAYSLIHDDLPAMDNADLRRGKPSCHKAFSEDVAILAGDTLQTLAIEIIAHHPSALTPEQRLAMIKRLTQASGLQGMAAGQALDIIPNQNPTQEQLTLLYQLKTGALFQACAELSLIAANAHDKTLRNAILAFTQKISLAFQIQDDVLDIESATQILGKPQGIDQMNQKITYPKLIGIDAAKKRVKHLFQESLTALETVSNPSLALQEYAHYIMQRTA